MANEVASDPYRLSIIYFKKTNKRDTIGHSWGKDHIYLTSDSTNDVASDPCQLGIISSETTNDGWRTPLCVNDEPNFMRYSQSRPNPSYESHMGHLKTQPYLKIRGPNKPPPSAAYVEALVGGVGTPREAPVWI